jgi:acetyl-CoA carboxylase biotin carboxyl carrier protein
MNLQEIKSLIDAMAASDLSEMELTRDGTLLRLVREKRAAAATGQEPPPKTTTPWTPRPGQTPASVLAEAGPVAAPAPNEITAPLYGVVHWRPSPDAPPFVTPGQEIKAGQLVCVVEAMKVFNEIRAEHDATVLALLVESGQEVDAAQPLLRLG